MGEKTNAVQGYVETQRARIEKSRNARKWFYRGVVATLAAGLVYAHFNTETEDTTEV